MSVKEMVKMTLNRGDVFGIEGYNLPRHEIMYKGRESMFPK
jgi:hypothetical protein